MRKLMILLMLAPLTIIGQEAPKETNEVNVEFVQVKEMPSKTKDEIFTSLKLGVAEIYRSAKDITQASEKEAGVIIIKPLFVYMYSPSPISPKETGRVNYTVRIDVKDGKYRVAVYDFVHTGEGRSLSGGYLSAEKPKCGTMNFPKKKWKEVKEKAQKEAEDLFVSLWKEVNNSTVKTDDTW